MESDKTEEQGGGERGRGGDENMAKQSIMFSYCVFKKIKH